MKNKKNKKKLVLKGKVQTILECIGMTAFSLIITTADSDWSLPYFKFLGIQILILVLCILIIKKYGNTKKYE